MHHSGRKLSIDTDDCGRRVLGAEREHVAAHWGDRRDTRQRNQLGGTAVGREPVRLHQPQVGADTELGLVHKGLLCRAEHGPGQRADRDREREQQHWSGVRPPARLPHAEHRCRPVFAVDVPLRQPGNERQQPQ